LHLELGGRDLLECGGCALGQRAPGLRQPPMDELVRLFAGYGSEILGPPLSLNDVS
jgi:hypothetical protein